MKAGNRLHNSPYARIYENRHISNISQCMRKTFNYRTEIYYKYPGYQTSIITIW